MFVKVCVPVVVTTLADKLIVTVLPLAAVVTFVPPAKVIVSESKVIWPELLSPANTTSISVSIELSTYALILCCVATLVAEFEDISSSSNTALPLAPVFNTALVIVGVVKVLFVDVSALSVNNIEPSASGKVCVLSAVGSANVKVVSKASSVAPSKDITRPGNINASVLISGNSAFSNTIASTTSVAEAI